MTTAYSTGNWLHTLSASNDNTLFKFLSLRNGFHLNVNNFYTENIQSEISTCCSFQHDIESISKQLSIYPG